MKTKTIFTLSALTIAGVLVATSCQIMPRGATVVKPFDVNRYLGKWYEIARFDFRFEKHMNNVTAEYSLNDDGSIKVVNTGYDTVAGKWKQAVGKAKFRGEPTEAKLKVSFFGPFYSSYNVIALDDNYQYALVAGKNLDYLWILSRTTTIPEEIKQAYVEKARSIGYDTNKLIWVEHDKD